MSALFLGGDLGGSTTRIVIEDAAGKVVGEGTATAGNPVSQPKAAHSAFDAALRAALAGVDPARVTGGVIGVAGSVALRDPARRAAFDAVWERCGLEGSPQIVSDLEVAYASAASEPCGIVLIAGTGASAARIRNWQIVERRGGYGWLLGDEGAGIWLGRAAVRAALDAISAGRTSRLTELVLAQLDVARSDDAESPWAGASATAELIRLANDAGPPGLAQLAPLVSRAHAEHSTDAVMIVDQAARLLVTMMEGLLEHESETSASAAPIVLAGSLMSEALPTGRAVREHLSPAHGARLRFAGTGIRGALRLARRTLDVP